MIPMQGGVPPQPAPAGMPGSPPGGAPGAPPQAGGAPQGGPRQIPPKYAQHIDPNNPMQVALLQRVDQLTPQDAQALQSAPQAMAVMKKIVPELGFVFDAIAQGYSGPKSAAPPGGAPAGAPGAAPAPQPGGGPAPMPGAAPGGGAPPPRPMPPQFAQARPTTALNRIG